MSTSTPVQAVCDVLAEAGFVVLDAPVVIADVEFDFAAVLTRSNSLDLVVVVDTVVDANDIRILNRIGSLAKALDAIGSKRALSVVLVGPLPRPSVLEELGRSGRVLSVGITRDENEMRDALAVLLPLAIPDADDSDTRPWEALVASAISDGGNEARALVSAAERGPLEVRRTFAEHMTELIREGLRKGGGGK